MRFVRKLLIFGMFLCGLTAAAETSASRGCSLDARNRYNMPLPVIGGGEMPAALAAEIRHGFDLIYVRYQPKEAELVLQPALQQSVAQHNVCGEALASFGLGQVARSQHVADALAYFRHSEELLREVGTPMALAHVHNRISFTEALTGNTEQFSKDEPPVAGEFLAAGDFPTSILERSMMARPRDGEAPSAYQERLFGELDAATTPNVTMVRGFVENQWAIALQGQGRASDAMEHARKSIAYLKQCDCGPVTQAGTYKMMAELAARDDDPATTLAYALEMDRIYREIHLDSQRASSLRAIASAYDALEDYSHAIPAYQKALDLAVTQQIPDNVTAISVAMAQAYGMMGEPFKGLDLIARIRPEKEMGVQRCRYDAALAVLQPRAMLWWRGEQTDRAWLKDCGELFPPYDSALANGLLGECLMGEGHLDEALIYARRAVEILEEQRKLIPMTDRNLAAFQFRQRGIYDILVNTLIALHQPEEALLASEQIRGRPFLDLVSSGRAVEGAASPAVTVEASHTPRVSEQTTRGVVGIPGASEPTLRSRAHAFTLTSADIRQSVGDAHSTLVSYWVGLNAVTIWVMTPGKPIFMTQSPTTPAMLTALVDSTFPGDKTDTRDRGVRVRTRSGESQAVLPADYKPWRSLYDILIAPIAAQLPTDAGSLLTIVPEENLHRLSFAALMAPDGHYLIERYAIHTIPAAGVLQVTARNDREASAAPAKYVVVANPERFPQVDGHTLPPLPGTDAEAHGIVRELRGQRSQLLEGSQAGIDTLTAALPEATVLHLATHAVVSDSAPMTSFLALDSRQQGGTLTATSIYGLHMHTTLVVLSACSTGRGKISGDGVAGLGRAFFFAGAASLITTLWDVVDGPTAELMPRLYTGLAKGESRSAALRDAQLGLIKDLRTGRVKVQTLSGATVVLPENPAYWAAFSLSGQP